MLTITVTLKCDLCGYEQVRPLSGNFDSPIQMVQHGPVTREKLEREMLALDISMGQVGWTKRDGQHFCAECQARCPDKIKQHLRFCRKEKLGIENLPLITDSRGTP